MIISPFDINIETFKKWLFIKSREYPTFLSSLIKAGLLSLSQPFLKKTKGSVIFKNDSHLSTQSVYKRNRVIYQGQRVPVAEHSSHWYMTSQTVVPNLRGRGGLYSSNLIYGTEILKLALKDLSHTILYTQHCGSTKNSNHLAQNLKNVCYILLVNIYKSHVYANSKIISKGRAAFFTHRVLFFNYVILFKWLVYLFLSTIFGSFRMKHASKNISKSREITNSWWFKKYAFNC